jgi:hypothetical protein
MTAPLAWLALPLCACPMSARPGRPPQETQRPRATPCQLLVDILLVCQSQEVRPSCSSSPRELGPMALHTHMRRSLSTSLPADPRHYWEHHRWRRLCRHPLRDRIWLPGQEDLGQVKGRRSGASEGSENAGALPAVLLSGPPCKLAPVDSCLEVC